MSNPKGTRFETECVNLAIERGWPDAARLPKKGADDEGDLYIVPDVTIEAKNRKALDLAGAIDQAKVERDNAGTAWAVAVVKRRGKGAAGAYLVQEFGQWLDRERAILDRLARLELLEQRYQTALDVFVALGAELRLSGTSVTLSFVDPDEVPFGPSEGPDGPVDDGPLPLRFRDPYDEGLGA